MAQGNRAPIAFTENIRRYPLCLVILLSICVVLLSSCGGSNVTVAAPPTSKPKSITTLTATPVVGVTHVTITMTAKFQPASIQVPVVTTVTWTNNDNVGHTVTFRNGMKDSGILLAGGIGTFRYTFTSKGIFPYYDKIDYTIVGVVTVT